MEQSNALDEDQIVDYQMVLEKAQVDKPRVFFFVRQLQITFILTRSLIRVFTPTLLHKFMIKLKHLCQNIHQNFLLMIDMILKEFFLQTQISAPYDQTNKHELFAYTQRGLKVTQTVEYKLLTNINNKKLRSKERFAKTLTSFRQNNEVNIQHLKKIVKFIVDSYSQECLPYKVLAFDIQEIMRQYLTNERTATGSHFGDDPNQKGVQ